MHLATNCFRLLCCLLLSLGSRSSARAHGRATMLYDAFGNSEHLKKDWGFSVLIEYSGKKILFDTGNNSKIFAGQCQSAGCRFEKPGLRRDFPSPWRPH
jgi:7,8-dihydropterin-6-yl-methyl-4-(beta-D-ribofuranosyl)aminobenzene 5'-phosphate synthase